MFLFWWIGKKSISLQTTKSIEMKRVLLYNWIFFLLTVMIGCSKEDAGTGDDTGTPIEFTASSPYKFVTRSVIDDSEDLQSAGFGVFAYYTGNSAWADAGASTIPNFMYNQEVTYDTDHWTYSPVKYWPNNNNPADGSGATGSQSKSYISFFAYAPYNGNGISLSEYPNTATGAPTITYTWGKEDDLLYASQLNCYKYDSDDDKDNGRVGDVVSFNFAHALALVKCKVRRKSNTGMDVTLKSLSLSGFYTSGTFNLGSSAWSSPSGTSANQPIYSSETGLSVSAYTEGTAQEVGSSLMIPGTPLQYTIVYYIGKREYTHTDQTISISLEKGHQYSIIFTIDGNDIIVDINKFTEQW